MSIISSIYADHANKIRWEWIKELEKAKEEKDWKAIEILLEKMKAFYFDE